MTYKIFWEDPYLTQLEARITSVNGSEVTVDRTIFYAFSGGQESDSGTIENRRVIRATKNEKEILYTLDGDHSFQPGDLVTMTIDWTRRYKLMRLHFASEIVLELTYRTLESIQKIGAHIAEDKSRIDFQWSENISKVLPAIQEQALALIAADHDIVSAFSDVEAEKRYWEIAGFARVPCGGTHLRKTGEVGPIELKRKNVGKNKERIEIYCA
jgi:Ser-tRNA(Ala) deacylase AlaX